MPLVYPMGAVAVALIYIIYDAYRDHLQTQLKRERTLRERVSYLLWVLGTEVE